MEKIFRASIGLALLSCTSTGALAQDAGQSQTTASPAVTEAATAGASSDIIVTARKRAESVQDVPISVSALGGTTLVQKAITNFDSLTTSLSGVTNIRSANNILTFYIRGLGTGSGNDSFEQSVALFIDGTYAGRPAEYNQGLFDAERVEVIKGTQAALLAKNTSLGAISVISRKPGDAFAFNFSGNYEFALGSRDLQGGVDVPVSDTLSVRFAGQSSIQSGFVNNPITNKDGLRTNSLAGRMVAVWKPTTDFDATLFYQAYKTKQDGSGEEFIADIFGNARARSVAGGFVDFETKLDLSAPRSDSRFGDTNEATTGQRVIGTLNYELGRYTLTSVTAYSEYRQDRQFDNDNLPGDYASVPLLYNKNNQVTQELRLTSPSQDRFNFLGGVLFLRENWRYGRDVFGSRGNLPATYRDITSIGGAPVGTPTGGNFSERFALQTTTFSGFGQANYSFTDWFIINAGIRATKEKRRADYFRTASNLQGSWALVFAPLPAKREGFTKSNIDGSIGAQVKLGRGKLLYASYSKGTKGGGYFNSPATLSGAERYKPEVARTIEAGTKLTFGPSYFNLALFRTKVRNYQQAIFNGVNIISPQQNLSARGVEAEGMFELFDGFRAGGTVTYLDAKRKDVVTPINNNTRPLNAPRWSGDLKMQYSSDLNGDLRLTVESDLYFKSHVYFTTASATVGGRGAPATATIPKGTAYGVVNGRIGISSASGDWDIGLLGKNILDRRYITYARAATIPGGALASAGTPRTVAIQFSIRR